MARKGIPVLDFDDLITAIQALSAPSGTDVAIDATGMEIITATNAQGALKQLDTAVDSVNASLTNLGNLVCKNYFNAQSIVIDIGFEPTSSKNAVALLFNANQSAMILVRLDGTPDIKKVFGSQTWTITKSGTSYTITPSATLWGMTTALIDHN